MDNGSDDASTAWLHASWPQVKVEVSREPLSFARAVNRGIAAARYSRICLVNNDMLLEPGFFASLDKAFDAVPDLFCATAQIRFPAGVRREETGKAVLAQASPEDFPVRCDEPLGGEDLTYVLYGSGGCSLYDAGKLRALGAVDQAYEPAYVEDLDLGYRAWQLGWPSVYVAQAVVEHRHRATTSRYYTAEQLDAILEINYLKFLARSVYSPDVFRRLWRQAIERLRLRAPRYTSARLALRGATRIALSGGPATAPKVSEDRFLALTNGTVYVFPGHAATGKPRALIAADASGDPAAGSKAAVPKPPQDYDSVLVLRTANAAAPPAEMLAAYVEVVLVRASHSAELSFRAALQQTVRKWKPEIARLSAQAAKQYAAECAPARIIAAESDRR